MGNHTSTLPKDDVAALEEAMSRAFRLIREGNYREFATLFTDDGSLHPPHVEAVRGRAGIEAFFEAMPPLESLEMSNLRVAGEGNLAYATCAYSLTLKDLPPDTGKEVLVFCKNGGTWKCIVNSWNSDLPLPG